MAREINKLTASRVKSLTTPGMHADGNSLYLDISKSGTKSWAIIYQFGGKRRQMGLGPCTIVSLAQAREKVRDIKAGLHDGKDPLAKEAEAKTAPSFGDVALAHIDSKKTGWKNAKHEQQWRNTLTIYTASIWAKPVDEVNVEDVLAILRPIWATKPETASRVRGRIEAVLDAAKVRRLRSGENPALWKGNLALLLPSQRKSERGHHSAMAYSDVPAFMKRLARLRSPSATALNILIHTAARTSEVLNAEWSEFDLAEKVWIIPAARMKADKEHRVPLTRHVVQLLEALPRQGDFVFPGTSGLKPLSNMAMAMVMRRLKLEAFTVHGFRSSFRDWAGDCTDYPRDVAEHALAHQVGSAVEQAYRRGTALETRRKMMADWSAFITSAR